uniref:PDZ domain-containing protein n=1 Tax=Emiliania huxleyi TaxID=2903 RepID=A0A7S3TZN5_EMIHU
MSEDSLSQNHSSKLDPAAPPAAPPAAGGPPVLLLTSATLLALLLIARYAIKHTVAGRRLWQHRVEPTMMHLGGRVRGKRRGIAGFRVRGNKPTATARTVRAGAPSAALVADAAAYLKRSHALGGDAAAQMDAIHSLNDAAIAAEEVAEEDVPRASSLELASLPLKRAADVAAPPPDGKGGGEGSSTDAGDGAAARAEAEAAKRAAAQAAACLSGVVSSVGATSVSEMVAAVAHEEGGARFDAGPQQLAESLTRDPTDGFGLELHRDEQGRPAIAAVSGAARRSALRAGDRIISVGGQPTARHEEALAAIRASGDDLLLLVLRDPEARPVVAQGLGLDAAGGDLQDMEL